MHVLNIHGVNAVRLDACEPPVAGDEDVVVRIKACGVCAATCPTSNSGASIVLKDA